MFRGAFATVIAGAQLLTVGIGPGGKFGAIARDIQLL
jgi:hypothetical protein